MDGAAATVAAVSGSGLAVLDVMNRDAASAALVFALVGACVAFLKYNLAAPARIFLGDGGSMAIGFVLAADVMGVPVMSESGVHALIPAAFLVGMVIFDTTFRYRLAEHSAREVSDGARDHVTHRLLPPLRSPRAFVAVLGVVQTIFVGLQSPATEFGPATGVELAISSASLGVIAIWALRKIVQAARHVLRREMLLLDGRPLSRLRMNSPPTAFRSPTKRAPYRLGAEPQLEKWARRVHPTTRRTLREPAVDRRLAAVAALVSKRRFKLEYRPC
jgi:Glycosyl transferase family 4